MMRENHVFSDDGQFVVVTGSPTDGLEFTGPFNGYDEAAQWASGLGEAWWIEQLHPFDPADMGRDH